MIICCLPQSFFLLIELVQLYDDGWAYFSGWNIIDSTQLALFFYQFIYKCFFEVDHNHVHHSFDISELIQLPMMIFSIMKVIHYITIYQQIGFFINMLLITLQEMVPFIITYVFIINLFVIFHATLEVEIYEELDL